MHTKRTGEIYSDINTLSCTFTHTTRTGTETGTRSCECEQYSVAFGSNSAGNKIIYWIYWEFTLNHNIRQRTQQIDELTPHQHSHVPSMQTRTGCSADGVPKAIYIVSTRIKLNSLWEPRINTKFTKTFCLQSILVTTTTFNCLSVSAEPAMR